MNKTRNVDEIMCSLKFLMAEWKSGKWTESECLNRLEIIMKYNGVKGAGHSTAVTLSPFRVGR